MALAQLKSEITIGSWRFSGVHEVSIKQGIHGYAQSAFIKLPTRCVTRKGNELKNVVTGNQFLEGDKVVIKLGYSFNGTVAKMNTEFEGFVKRKNADMPIEIECEGYVRQLRLDVHLDKSYESTTVKSVLQDLIKGTDIQLQMDVDYKLARVKFTKATGDKVLDELKKMTEGCLSFFFIQPKVLWVGLVYTATLEGRNVFGGTTVNFRLGYNVVRDNDLKERTPSEPVQVFMNGQSVSGDTVRTQSDDSSAKQTKQYHLNNVPDENVLKIFAQEKANHDNYPGYDGTINAFLEPYCVPGYVANIVDLNYLKRNGIYLIESTEVVFGVNGARRKIGIGPRLS